MSFLILYGVDKDYINVDSKHIDDTIRYIQRTLGRCDTDCKEAQSTLEEIENLTKDIPDLGDVEENVETLRSEFVYLVTQKIEKAWDYLHYAENSDCKIKADLCVEFADELFDEIPYSVIESGDLDIQSDFIKTLILRLGKLRIYSESDQWNGHVLYKGSNPDFWVDVAFVRDYRGRTKINKFNVYHKHCDIIQIEKDLKGKGYDMLNLSEDDLTLLEMTNQYGLESIKAVHKLLNKGE